MFWLRFLITLAPYVLAVLPGIWIVSGVLRFTPLKKGDREQIDEHSTLSAWIGVFERWLVIFLIGRGEWSALGFIIAAKGLLRLPEIRREAAAGHDMTHVLSSYILLGTLISLTLAVILAEASAWLRCLIYN
jgi:hypothetical protein